MIMINTFPLRKKIIDETSDFFFLIIATSASNSTWIQGSDYHLRMQMCLLMSRADDEVVVDVTDEDAVEIEMKQLVPEQQRLMM